MKISLIQMRVRDGDVRRNIAEGIIKVREAATRADLIVLPELWTTGYSVEAIKKYSETLRDGWSIRALKGIAIEHNVYILSSIPLRDGGELYDSAILIGPEGVIGTYRKIHLFRPYDEDKVFSKGRFIGLFKTPHARIGVAICYDLRFPELFRILAMGGAEIILVPASWGFPRALQWRTLLRARAVENEVFVAGVNRVGRSVVTGEDYVGGSGIYDPFGYELAHSESSEEVITAEVDLSLIRKVRKKLPLWEDRRRDLYGMWSVWGIKD